MCSRQEVNADRCWSWVQVFLGHPMGQAPCIRIGGMDFPQARQSSRKSAECAEPSKTGEVWLSTKHLALLPKNGLF